MKHTASYAAVCVTVFALLSSALPQAASAAILSQDATLGTFDWKPDHGISQRYGFGQQERSTTVESSVEGTYNDTAVTFDLFDPILGTLTAVSITTIFRDLNATLRVNDTCITQRVPSTVKACTDRSSISGQLDYGLNFSNLTPFNSVIAPGVNTLNDTLDRVNYGFVLGDGNEFDLLETLAPTTFNSTSRSSAADLAAFTGVGTYSVNFASYWFNNLSTTCTGNRIFIGSIQVGQSDIETCSGFAYLDFTGSIEIGVRYIFDEPVVPPSPVLPSPVPLPAGLPLLLAGLGGLAVLRRTRRE